MVVDDAEILRLETVAIKGHTGKVLILAPDSAGNPLSVPALRDRVGQAVGEFHRLVQRVEEPRLGLGKPVWAPVDYIDLRWHIAQPDRAEPLSDEQFRQAPAVAAARTALGDEAFAAAWAEGRGEFMACPAGRPAPRRAGPVGSTAYFVSCTALTRRCRSGVLMNLA